MAANIQTTDGNYNIAGQVGPDKIRTPFSGVGDFTSFEIIRTYRVDYQHYHRGKSMEKIKVNGATAYLVEESDTEGIGDGILEFKRTYASVPITRIEGSSIVYNLQFVQDGQLVEFPIPMNAGIKFEYATRPFKEQRAPKIVQFGNGFVFVGGWGSFVPGKQYLAEDANTDIYKGGIFMRRGVYITWPDLAALASLA